MGLHVGEDAVSAADWDIDPLTRIEQMRAARDFLDLKIEQAVIEARTVDRAKGVVYDHVNGETRELQRFGIASWEQIARALGVTRAWAHRKYAHLIG